MVPIAVVGKRFARHLILGHEVRLELGARIREGERALHMERANAQMVEARLRAAGCR